MKCRYHQPGKSRRDIGRVTSLIETMNNARELSSCCVGVEAMLEREAGLDRPVTRANSDNQSRRR